MSVRKILSQSQVSVFQDKQILVNSAQMVRGENVKEKRMYFPDWSLKSGVSKKTHIAELKNENAKQAECEILQMWDNLFLY